MWQSSMDGNMGWIKLCTLDVHKLQKAMKSWWKKYPIPTEGVTLWSIQSQAWLVNLQKKKNVYWTWIDIIW